jgi:hypothetical protein
MYLFQANTLSLKWIVTLLLSMTFYTAQAMDFYVVADGNDAWSGRQSKANAEKTDGPFATLAHAQQAVRQQVAQSYPQDGIRVNIGGSIYMFQEPLQFDHRDSGKAETPVHYSAVEGQTAAITGAMEIRGFEPYKDGIFKVKVDPQKLQGAAVNAVYYRGQKQHAARIPNFEPKNPLYGGFAYTAGEAEGTDTSILLYNPDSVRPHLWKHPEKATLDIFPGYNYGNRRVHVTGVDAQNHTIKIEKLDYKPVKGDRFFVENVFEELDAPGEWYYDGADHALYFWPPDDGQSFTGSVSIPTADSLVVFDGARHIVLSGLTLRYCNKSAVVIKNSEHISIAGCTISDAGEKAVEILPASRHNKIISNDITRTGDYAITMTAPLFNHDQASHNIISNNLIYKYGTVLKEIAGIGIFGGGDNTVSHNWIHHSPRWGVFINSGARNIVEYNHIHDMSLETEDTGAVYMGTAHGGWELNMDVEKNKLHRGNMIRYNLIHDTLGYGMTGWWTTTKGQWTKPYYSWSIYLDLAVSGTHIYGNICYNSHLGGLAVGGGQDNIAENNIFVNGSVAQICTVKWDSTPPNPDIKVQFKPSGNRFERNIISYTNPDARLYWFVYQYGSGWKPDEFSFDYNIIHCSSRTIKLEAAGLEDPQWQSWLGRGMDVNSILADPLFKDASKHDYRLKEDSPAFKLGFKPIPVEKIGLYCDAYRKKMPQEN